MAATPRGHIETSTSKCRPGSVHQEAHEGYIRRTIKPVLGQVKIRMLGADSLDGQYAAPWTSCTCVRLDRPGSSTSCA